jgi:hypothetical protein
MVDADVSSPDAPATNSVVQQLQTGDASVWQTKYPTSPWLQLDTRENAEKWLPQALAYLERRRA